MVRVEDAHAHCERARAHGARIVTEPNDFEYGERQYAAEDLAGHQWTFSQTLADVAPEEWGGVYLTRLATPRVLCDAATWGQTPSYTSHKRGLIPA